MRLERLVPGRVPPPDGPGAVLTRDLAVEGRRLAKGTRLTAGDLALVQAAPPGPAVTILVPGPDDVHEDRAALRLAAAVTADDAHAAGVALRGPVQSRVDLVAALAGVVEVRLGALERVNRIDPLEVFTVFDGQVVEPGDLVASVKIGPHLVPEGVLARGEAMARRTTAGRGGGPLVRVRGFRPVRMDVLVKEHVEGAARTRFEETVRAKAAGLGAAPPCFRYLPDETAAVTDAMAAVVRGADGDGILLTAGGASTDPADPFFVALEALGGRIVRRGVPSHPGSMLWLGRIGRTTVVGLPSCGAYAKATAFDLLLPRLVAGQPPTAATVARLAHGGILARSQRFRFPAYARDLDAPDG